MNDDRFAEVTAEQPAVAPPTPASTSSARAALERHIRAQHADRSSRRQLRPVMAAAAAVLVLIAGAALVIERRSDVEIVAADPDRNVSRIDAATESSTQGDLFDQPVDLNDYVKAIETSPAPTGDATVAARTHTGLAAPRSGVDVYLDDGRYAYAPTIDAIEIEGGALRQWPGSTADVLAALERSAAAPPGNALATFRAALGNDETTTLDDPSGEAWRLLLPALPIATGQLDTRVGAVRVLAELEGLSVAGAQDSGRVAFTLSTSAGSERVVLDESGRLIRYERSRSGGPDEVVEFTIERVDSGDLES
ncbi:MAG: hypothetical protein R2733_06755 [Acidimicrobiales bacterium]